MVKSLTDPIYIVGALSWFHNSWETTSIYPTLYMLLDGWVLHFVKYGNYSEYPIFNAQFKLLPNFLKNITNYPSDLITYTVVSGGN